MLWVTLLASSLAIACALNLADTDSVELERGFDLLHENSFDLSSKNATPRLSDLKRIHLISTGRQGSCALLDMVTNAGSGLPKIFEPLNGIVEGSSIYAKYSNQMKKDAIACLFSEDVSQCGSDVVNPKALSNLQEFLSDPGHPPLVIKTTRIVDLRLIPETLSTQQLESSRFVVMTRDPRSVWASLKPWTGWAVHSIPLICTLLAETALTVPALAAAAPGHVSVAVYEKWSVDLAHLATDVANFVGLDGASMTDWAEEHQRSPSDPKWLQDLTASEIAEIESDAHCSAYMDRIGYKRGATSGSDYSGLASQEELLRPLESPAEIQLLESLRLKLQSDLEKEGVKNDENILMEFEYAA